VLPIKNLTGDPSKAYFADGLTDVLISNLARVRALRVPSFEAVAPFRDKTDQAEIAKTLGVELLLAGSITQADSKFRMAVQLIDPTTGTVKWGEELTRDPSGVLSAQAEGGASGRHTTQSHAPSGGTARAESRRARSACPGRVSSGADAATGESHGA
jgi:TolB-like protein